MLLAALKSQRHPALAGALPPAVTPMEGGAEPCLDLFFVLAGDRIAGCTSWPVPMWNKIENRFGSRGLRGVEVGVLTRKVLV